MTGTPISLQFGHGTSAVETPSASNSSPRTLSLQFGHGTSAVETGHAGCQSGNRPQASIRPRHIGRGNWPTSANGDWAKRRLQFGHGTSAVETGVREWIARGNGCCFNSATAHRPWRQCRAMSTPATEGFVRLQFGHGTSAVETRRYRSQACDFIDHASIRPRHIGRGDVEVAAVAGVPTGASIRPRHIGRGDAWRRSVYS